MDLIVEMRFGSHLYGTATPASDLDYKGVYLPEGRDILLQRARPTISGARAKAAGERNGPGDVDREIHSLQRYLGLLAEGQTMALDMLFAPDAAMTGPVKPLWREIQANVPLLVTREASAFLRYCRQQANKYGIKGARLAIARQALALLIAAEETFGSTAKLGVAEREIKALADMGGHAGLVDLPMPDGRMARHWEVCGKKLPFTASIKSAREVVRGLVSDHGQRALQAERDDGIDWKALSHAVRVGREAVELFETGRIVFPLSCAPELRAIRGGALKYADVAAAIERLAGDVETAARSSTLREKPDQNFIDDLVARAHRGKVMESA